MSTTNCLICSLPLGELEISVNRKWHFDCERCAICGGEVSDSVINECLTDEREVSHKPCHDKKMATARDARPVEVTQGLLDYLNEIRLMVEPQLQYSIEDNQSTAEKKFNNYIHEKSIDEIFITLRKLQAVTACCSILLNDKQKKEVSIRINVEEKRRRETDLRSKVTSAEDYRKSEQYKLERKREKLTPEGKAIAQLMKTFGWSEDVARTHLKSMKGSIQ